MPADNACDYQKFAILHVDDDENFLESVSLAHGHTFRIISASSAQAGLEILRQRREEIGILLTDQKMPGEKGVWLLEQARQLDPRIVRILMTGFTDYADAVLAINAGAIYKYIHKDEQCFQELEQTLKRGLELFMLQRERDQLLQERTAMLRHVMMTDRLASLRLLAMGLSQHIRNPLTAVKTFFQLLPAELEKEAAASVAGQRPDFWVTFRQSAESQLDRVDNLLSELWTAVQMSGCQFEDAVNLHAVVEGCIAAQLAGLQSRQISVENQIPADLPALRADPGKLCHLFERLLKDEQISLPPGAHITFKARITTDGEFPVVEMIMNDDGPGLSEADLRSLLEPFALRSDVPTEYGIHLVGCHFIARNHGGSIEARRREGRGTEFVIRLPLDPEAALSRMTQDDLEQRLRQTEEAWQELLRQA